MAQQVKDKEQTKPVSKAVLILTAAAFFAGMILAIVAGIVTRESGAIVLALVIMGIIVGLFNISTREMVPFLVSAIALIVAGTGIFDPLNDVWDGLGRSLNSIVHYVAVFMTPAAIINAMRMVWYLARPGG